MEQVARDYHEVRFKLYCFVDEFVEGVIKVLPAHFQTVLRVSQVQVGGVDKTESLQTKVPFDTQLDSTLTVLSLAKKQSLSVLPFKVRE